MLKLEFEVHRYKSGQRLCTKDIGNIVPGRRIGLGREDDGFLAFGHDIGDGELDRCTDASVSLQKAENLAIFSFDVPL